MPAAVTRSYPLTNGISLRRAASRDPELSPFLGHRRHMHAAVHKVQDAIGAEPERDWDMASLAALGHVTERHLLRLFIDQAGASPMQCLQAIGSSARGSRSSMAPASPMRPRSRAFARA